MTPQPLDVLATQAKILAAQACELRQKVRTAAIGSKGACDLAIGYLNAAEMLLSSTQACLDIAHDERKRYEEAQP